jgi:uridine kinase
VRPHQLVLFCLVALLKLGLACKFGSSYPTEFFIPFLKYFVGSGFENPYQHFAGIEIQSFPYPALMLYILGLPYAIASFFLGSWANLNFDLFLLRLPLLAADIGIFIVLISWLKEHRKTLFWIYWLNPVLIYITYIHGQLDVLPTAFIFISLAFLFKGRVFLSALLLGCALATKHHVFLVIPFYFLYLYLKGFPWKQIALVFAIFVLTYFLFNLPYLNSPGFQEMVFKNAEQAKLFQFQVQLGPWIFYFVPAIFLLLLIRGLAFKDFSKDIFIMFLAFAFCLILATTPPMPGWYFWVVPFLCYFFVSSHNLGKILFWTLHLFYFLHFLTIAGLEGPQGPSFVIQNTFFTFLQTTLAVTCFIIYRQEIERFDRRKLSSTPFLVGIGGNSGSGKSTLSNAIQNVLGAENTTIIQGDDMHRWERSNSSWLSFSHLNPLANHLHKEIQYLKDIKAGRNILRRSYDHSGGIFTVEKKVRAKKVVLYEGLHAFYLQRQRTLYDLKIFVKPDEALRKQWKIQRDVHERGYDFEKVTQQLESREADQEKYIYSQEQLADILIVPHSADKELISVLNFEIIFPNSVFVENLLIKLNSIPDLKLTHEYVSNEKQRIVVQGSASSDQLVSIAKDAIPHLVELNEKQFTLPSSSYGAVILLVVYFIFMEAQDASF